MQYQFSYSIIIPHYNIPDLLIRCLNSIPIREDVQVIVVDDCSPGADKYKEMYPELSRPYLEYYSTPIGGSAGRARNIGLDHAKGKWVICMDSDDLFVDNMEEILAESFDRTEDVLFYNYKSVMSDNLSMEASQRSGANKLFSIWEKIHDEKLFRFYYGPLWGKIFKNELIQKYNIRCDETRHFNDRGFSYRCGALAKTIGVINKTFFIITLREGSLDYDSECGIKVSPKEIEIKTISSIEIYKFNREFHVKNNANIYAGIFYDYFNLYPFYFTRYYFSYLVPNYPNLAFELMCYIPKQMIKGKLRIIFGRKIIDWYRRFRHIEPNYGFRISNVDKK